jgi:hypothetical protein
MSVRRDRCRSVAAGWFDARSRSIRAGRLSSMSSRPSAQSSTQHQVENLAASLKRVSRQKKVLEDWTATLERTVGAHEQVTREREAIRASEIAAEEATVLAEQQAHAAEILAEQQAHAAEIASEQAAHCAELRVRSQELAAVDRRLRRTLESQSFRIGHLVVRIAVSPVKAARWSWRLVRRVLVAAYRLGQRTLPAPVVEPIQQVAAKLEVASIRRHEVLDLPGDGPVAFVDCRGLAADVRTATYERIVESDEPVRTIVLTEEHDFTYLRELGLSFEYLPPFVEGTPWWDDVVDHERFVAERMVAMRLGYGADDF